MSHALLSDVTRGPPTEARIAKAGSTPAPRPHSRFDSSGHALSPAKHTSSKHFLKRVSTATHCLGYKSPVGQCGEKKKSKYSFQFKATQGETSNAFPRFLVPL